ncbi:MAG: HDOD domain-containing protein [Candidatus Glassbacteria bacterium]|nr:HDOD domain-containing protein [Candidatus Glassbacteria bacterium]
MSDEISNGQGSEEVLELIINLVNKSDISSIKQIVSEILEVIRDEDSSAKDLKDIIERDPPLCARLLRLANSAHYGYAKTISDIQEAIICIGFDAVRELALNQKVCELFKQEDVRYCYSRWELWKHSSAVAVTSKMIYRREFRKRGDDIYVAGLLHDIGIIVEDQFFPELFNSALETFCRGERNLDDIEREILKIDHAMIGRTIGEDWEFPDDLIQAIGMHHDPSACKRDQKQFVYTVYLANYICQRDKIGFIEVNKRDATRYHKYLSELGISEKSLNLVMEDVRAELKKLDELDKFD